MRRQPGRPHGGLPADADRRGGHRFFSKSQEVEDLWTELLGEDLLHRPRSSRIYYVGYVGYVGKFYAYRLKAGEALRNLGVVE